MNFSPAIEELIEALRCLPGVGPKSAQRMTLHLLERDREGAQGLSAALSQAVNKVDHCQRCRNLTELDICEICIDPRRDASIL
jgi:recombination protein RecR